MQHCIIYLGKQAGTEPIHGCIFQESHTDAEPGRDELLMLIGKSHKKEWFMSWWLKVHLLHQVNGVVWARANPLS